MFGENNKLSKIIVICGPTASGKTGWSLKLAKKFNGEIISADSRQIYKKMNIGTAKEPGKWQWQNLRQTYFVGGIPHHLIDFLNPGKSFSAAEFRDKAVKYIKMAERAKKLPIVVGGTGLYIRSVVDNLQIPQIKANQPLRKSLEEKSIEELVVLLQKLDEKAVKVVDQKNKRRLIRAIEVCILSGVPFSEQQNKGEPLFSVLQIGIDLPREELYNRINQRVENQLEQGLEKEVTGLIKQKYSWDLPSLSGIGYREFKDYFAGLINLDQLKENLKQDTRNYAKKQLTWFRKDKRIVWLKNYEEAEKLVEEFLKS